MKFAIPLLILFAVLFATPVLAQETVTLRIETENLQERSDIADSGSAIQYVHPTEGWIIAEVPEHRLEAVRNMGLIMTVQDTKSTFPNGYEKYHDYAEQIAELGRLHTTYPAVTDLFSIGQTHEGQELMCLKISDNAQTAEPDEGAILIVALHHAREILSPEIALYTAGTLLDNYATDPMIRAFVDQREIYVIPSLNPDGGEYDHSAGFFRLWRKNRSPNDGHTCKGVDLNRNYGFEWGGVGSTGLKCDLTYRGTEPFSEPETRALRDFVLAQENLHVLVTLHTYSELILYPWSHTFETIDDQQDLSTFQTLARYMAEQNGYTDQQSSDLYRTTGDTTDWAYGELGIFAYTFELSPASPFGGAFYPEPNIFNRALPDNYNALLLAIGLARDPHLVLSTELWKFNATLADTTTTIEWASVVETDPTGWNMLRSDNANDGFEPINTTAIAPGQPDYVYVDEGLVPGNDYYYKIEYLSETGNDQLFGPVMVTVPSPGDDDDDDITGDDDDDNDDSEAGDDDDNDDESGCCG